MRTMRTLACVSCILFFSADLGALVPDRKAPPRSIDEEMIGAYEKIGATYGSMGAWFTPGRAAAESGLPAFCFPGGPPGHLPDAGVPFGLHLGYYAANRPAGWVPKNADQAAPMSDAEMRHLRGLKNLDRLFLYTFSLSDTGMKELANLENLRTLDLVVPVGVTDAGLKKLESLQGLREFSLTANHVTDAGMKELAKLRNLSVLSLVVPKLSDVGLKDLATLKGLSSLTLQHTQG